MFSGFFFSQIGSQGTPPASLPGGTGLVVVSDGAGQKLDYGAAYQYARMNAAGTVMQFVDPVMPNGGLVLTAGQLGVRLPPVSGLELDGSGLFVRTDATTAINLVGNRVALTLATNPGLEVAAQALKAKVDTSTMQLTAAGIGVDASKVATLSGSKITAGNSRGMTTVAIGKESTDVGFAITGTTYQTHQLTTISGIQVGDILCITSWQDNEAPAATAGVAARLQITSSPTANTGTVYATAETNSSYSTGVGIPEQITAAVAGTYYVHLQAKKWSSGHASFNVVRRRTCWELKRL